MSAFYRFDKKETERLSMLKGEDSWYEIRDAEDRPVYHGHVIGSALGGTSTFHASRESAEVLFRIEPKRRFLNLTYYVAEGASGPRIATLRLFAGRGMKVLDAGGREAFRIVDPQGKLDKFMMDVLEGACGRYAIVDDDRVVGTIEPRVRPERALPPDAGRWRRLVHRVFKHVLTDWCIELEDGGKAIPDHRALVAAMIVLKEQSIRLEHAR